MADTTETVTLIAPNGQRVTVAASKKHLRLAAGYRLPDAPKRPGRPRASKPAGGE